MTFWWERILKRDITLIHTAPNYRRSCYIMIWTIFSYNMKMNEWKESPEKTLNWSHPGSSKCLFSTSHTKKGQTCGSTIKFNIILTTWLLNRDGHHNSIFEALHQHITATFMAHCKSYSSISASFGVCVFFCLLFKKKYEYTYCI